MYRYLIILLIFFYGNLFAYESEDNLKAALISKIANFVKWEDCRSEEFVITIFHSDFANPLNQDYIYTTLKEKKVIVKNIKEIKELKNTNILFIQKISSEKLNELFKYIEGKNILTISDMRGFTEKGGIVQIYSLNQKLKIRINIDTAKKEKLKIKASLLRLADVVGSQHL